MIRAKCLQFLYKRWRGLGLLLPRTLCPRLQKGKLNCYYGVQTTNPDMPRIFLEIRNWNPTPEVVFHFSHLSVSLQHLRSLIFITSWLWLMCSVWQVSEGGVLKTVTQRRELRPSLWLRSLDSGTKAQRSWSQYFSLTKNSPETGTKSSDKSKVEKTFS